MAGESAQKMKVKTTKELTEEVKSLKDVNDLLLKKVENFENVIKDMKKKFNETKEEVEKFKEQRAKNQFECLVCDLKFSNKSLMKEHDEETHGKVFKCQHCNHIFKELKIKHTLLLIKSK